MSACIHLYMLNTKHYDTLCICVYTYNILCIRQTSSYKIYHMVTILSKQNFAGDPKKRSLLAWFAHGFPMLPSMWVAPILQCRAPHSGRASGAHGQGANGPADRRPIQANLKAVDKIDHLLHIYIYIIIFYNVYTILCINDCHMHHIHS